MDKLPASIFNDVIGPVMRGPSSSHVAGAARIGSIVRQSLSGHVKKVLVDFDTNGSLAESYHGHGSDIGFVSGILGMEMTDALVPHACEIAQDKGVDVQFRIYDYGAIHPNNYRIEACSEVGVCHKWEAVSVGGGMIEMQQFNGFRICICGDFFELLVMVDTTKCALENALEMVQRIIGDYEDITSVNGPEQGLINVKTIQQPKENTLDELRTLSYVLDVVNLQPILPTKSSAKCKVPFTTAAQLLEWSKSEKKELWELAALYESKRGNTSEQEAFDKMYNLVGIMENCIAEGLSGTEYSDRILGQQSNRIEEGIQRSSLVPGDVLNQVIKYITSIMEVKSSMGVIVAAPTAGSCGCLPGTVLGVGETMGMSREEITKGMLAAGLIGVFISENATFAAEVAGCQVECGAGSGMAAAGVAQLFHGTVEQCIDAASMALQNVTGLACDPVANRVEVPCLGKNIMGGANAIASANMALAGYDKVIPLDETIAAMYDIGLKLPLELRCTFGGLGKTKTSLDIRKRLK